MINYLKGVGLNNNSEGGGAKYYYEGGGGGAESYERVDRPTISLVLRVSTYLPCS